MRYQFYMLVALPCLLLLHTQAGAQAGTPSIQVVGDDTGQPVERVHVAQLQGAFVGVTNGEGRLLLNHLPLPATLRLTHVSYEDRQVHIRPGDQAEDGHLEIRLVPRVILLQPVDVARPGAQVVYQRNDLHVGACHVNKDGLWVLVYEKSQLWHRHEHAGRQVLRGARLHLLDTLFREVGMIQLPSKVRALHRDHLGRPVVEGEVAAWVAERHADEIMLGVIDLETLHKAVLPWKDTLAGMLLGDDRVDHYPAFEHLAFDPIGQRMHTICSVEDRHVMQLFRSQYKYMSGPDKVVAMDMEQELGIDREIIAGYMTGFNKDIYFRVPYAPLFVANGTLNIFDHSLERIRRFDGNFNALDEVPMVHHRDRSWKRQLIQDPVNGIIWSIHVRDSRMRLKRIDPTDGRVVSDHTIQHPWPEEVNVYDGHVYYVYRPHGSLQHRTLYREQLP
jgi:hypothetical protein